MGHWEGARVCLVVHACLDKTRVRAFSLNALERLCKYQARFLGPVRGFG